MLLLGIPNAKTLRSERKREGKRRGGRIHMPAEPGTRKGEKKIELKTSGGAEERAGREGEGRGRLSSEEGPPFG